MVKISNDYVSADKWIGAVFSVYTEEEVFNDIEITEDVIVDMGNGNLEIDETIACLVTDFEIPDGPSFTPGIWIICNVDEAGTPIIYVQSIERCEEIGELKKLDEKYLPDNIGGQADWNENDPEAKSYIQNRTHWEEAQENVLIDETVNLIYQGDYNYYYSYSLSTYQTIVRDEVYYITFNGETYEGTGYDYGDDGTGVNWYFDDGRSIEYQASSRGIRFFNFSFSSSSFPIKIFGYNRNIQTLDEKFIPDSIARTDEVINSIANAINPITGSAMMFNSSNITLPTSQMWNTPTYADGKYVIMPQDSSNVAAFSDDGTNWIKVDLPTSQCWNTPIYVNDIFVITPNNRVASNIAAYSTDGINWIQTTLPAIQKWNTPTHINDKIIIMPNTGETSSLNINGSEESNIGAYSTDGINWTEFTLPKAKNWNHPVYGNGLFVVSSTTTAYNQTGTVAYSADGINWNLSSTPEYNTPTHQNDPLYANGVFVITGRSTSDLVYSTDGINWKLKSIGKYGGWNAPLYGNGVFLVSANGDGINGSSADYIWYSTDGINWNQSILPVNQKWNTPVFAEGMFVITPFDNSTIGAYSSDGINWVQTTLPITTTVNQPVYCRDKFIAVSRNNSGIAIYSVDGINWQQITICNRRWLLNQPTYLNDRFIITPKVSTNTFIYSFDGIQWKTSYNYISKNSQDITNDVKKVLLVNSFATEEYVDTAIDEAIESGELGGDGGIYVGDGEAPEGTKVQIDTSDNGSEFTIPDVLQTTGDSEVDTMSQKAITEALASNSSSEEWETLYDTGTEGVTVDLITSFNQALNKTQDRYKEYRMTLSFSKDTSDETTGNKTVNIWIDGYKASYYQISIQENYIKNVFVHLMPTAPCINAGNKAVLDTFCFVFASEPAGHFVDKCAMESSPATTNGKLNINILSPFSGTIWCCVQGKK